ncbi:MAG: cbb3-type cytochrome c oxidase subunit I [Salinigranum sp.]
MSENERGTVEEIEEKKPRTYQEPTGWRYWLYTTNHKTIGIIYLTAGVTFFMLAGLNAMLFRTELITPKATIFTWNQYNALMTIHGITMIFLVLQVLGAGFGNYFLPLLIGADEMAFPRLNALGAFLVWAGGLLLWWPAIGYLLNLSGLPFYGGWFGYAPMSTSLTTVGARSWPLAINILTIGSTGTFINFLVTALNERKPDMRWLDVPLFVWGLCLTGLLVLYSFPWLTAAMSEAYFEATFHIGFFNELYGGSPTLYANLFWIFGHPEVYVVILPGFTAVLMLLPRFAGRPLWGRNVVIAGLLWIMFMSNLVWLHHMFTLGTGGGRYAFMFTSLGIILGFGVILYSFAATLWHGKVRLKTPMLFSMGFIMMLIISGLDGAQLGIVANDIWVHNTYFLVGHFHFTLFSSIMALFAGFYYWFPKMTGRMYDEFWGKVHFAFTNTFAILLFFFMGKLGELGMIRRYASYAYQPALQNLQMYATGCAYLIGAAQVVFVANMLWSWKYGEKVENPWKGLSSGQGMPTPEYDGFPFWPPTPTNVVNPQAKGGAQTAADGSGSEDGEAAPDGGSEPDDAAPDGGIDPADGPPDSDGPSDPDRHSDETEREEDDPE